MRFREIILAHNLDSDDLTNSQGGRKRTDDVQISENISFADLMISEDVLQGLKKAGFKKPSPIQLKAVPVGKLGLDLIVQAKSGTGKTLVFVVNALETVVIDNPAPQVLVLAPTREIANQIFTCFKRIGSRKIENGLSVRCFIGGVDIRQDLRSLRSVRGCQILVGSPGRLCQLIQEHHISLSAVRMLVLDEADKMMEEPFQQNVNWIFSQMPASKQVTVFSATYPDELDTFLSRYMDCPTLIRLDGGDVQLLGIKQYQSLISTPLSCAPSEKSAKIFSVKMDRLVVLLKRVTYSQVLIFCNYQDKAQEVAEKLVESGFPAISISAKLDQQERMDIMKRLKSFRVRLLVSTDLTARGIDAPNVNLVINFEVPVDTETYFHRIGRAGRYGGYGAAITLIVPSADERRFQGIGSEGQFHVMNLHDPESETIPGDLATNMDYWEKQDPVCFPPKKLFPRHRGKRPEKSRNGGKENAKPKEESKKVFNIKLGPQPDPGRLSPEEFTGTVGERTTEVGVESGKHFLYTREEFLQLNPQNEEVPQNGFGSVFDPIDDLEYWELPAEEVMQRDKQPANIFEPIRDLEYWEKSEADIARDLAANDFRLGKLNLSHIAFPVKKPRPEFGVPVKKKPHPKRAGLGAKKQETKEVPKNDLDFWQEAYMQTGSSSDRNKPSLECLELGKLKHTDFNVKETKKSLPVLKTYARDEVMSIGESYAASGDSSKMKLAAITDRVVRDEVLVASDNPKSGMFGDATISDKWGEPAEEEKEGNIFSLERLALLRGNLIKTQSSPPEKIEDSEEEEKKRTEHPRFSRDYFDDGALYGNHPKLEEDAEKSYNREEFLEIGKEVREDAVPVPVVPRFLARKRAASSEPSEFSTPILTYSREELQRILFRKVPDHQLRAYAESKWSFDEDPFVRDPAMRCCYSQQFRIMRARELAAKTNSGNKERWTKSKEVARVAGETRQETEVQSGSREETTRQKQENEELEEIERNRRDRAEKRLELLKRIGDLGTVEARTQKDNKGRVVDYDQLSQDLAEYVEQRRKGTTEALKMTGAAVAERKADVNWESECNRAKDMLEEMNGERKENQKLTGDSLRPEEESSSRDKPRVVSGSLSALPGFRPVAYTNDQLLAIWYQMKIPTAEDCPWMAILEECEILVNRDQPEEVGDTWEDVEGEEEEWESEDEEGKYSDERKELTEYYEKLLEWYNRACNVSHVAQFEAAQEYLNLMRV